jgi:predicted acylesterase/phospholipase RssA
MKTSPFRAILALFSLQIAATGCAHSWTQQSDRPTCLVLSAGGPAGLAHIGAIEAMQARHLPINCIAGTSMGALVGGLYASAPNEPLRQRYTKLVAAYREQSEWDTGRNAMIGGIVGAAIAALVTGGAAAVPLALGAGAGAAAGMKATAPVALERFGSVLSKFHEGQQIEDLPIAFATFFQQRQGSGLTLVTVRQGDLAQAVTHSIANPFIFPDFDPVQAGYVDPGADRMVGVPVQDACRLFPKARLLAVNVSGHPIVYSKEMTCPLLEVRVDVDPVDAKAMTGDNEEFERVVAAGYHAALRSLEADQHR